MTRRDLFDALGIAMILGPATAGVAFALWGVVDMIWHGDGPWRLLGLLYAGVIAMFAGIFVVTRNDRAAP